MEASPSAQTPRNEGSKQTKVINATSHQHVGGLQYFVLRNYNALYTDDEVENEILKDQLS